MSTKHERNVSHELMELLKRAEGFQLPLIEEVPPQPMIPKKISFTPALYTEFCSGIEASDAVGLVAIGLAKDNVRTAKAIHAFEKAGIRPTEFTHIGYYHMQPAENGGPAPIRYMLVW